MYPPVEGQPFMHPMHPYPAGAQWQYPSYGMYPTFQGYPYPPPQALPPPYGYQEHALPPRYHGDHLGAGAYTEGGGPMAAGQRGDSKASHASVDESAEMEDSDDEGSERKLPADTSSASRARLYVKSKVPTRQEILDRRARKNAQSRSRASKLRARVDAIAAKPDSERTEEERELYDSYQYRRQRKNDRSRERAIEKKTEIERILTKPEKKRTKIERDFLETALYAKQRKNQGDRLRRQRIKQQKMAAQVSGGDESYGMASHRVTSVGFTSAMSEIPMSPLPTSGPLHPSMASPATFTSPSIMPNIAFPSPPTARRPPGGPGSLEVPRGARSQPQAFVPTSQQFGTGDSPTTGSQLHMPQSSPSVEQRRHPDGSMTISIGRKAAGGPTYGEAGEGPPSPDTSASNAGNVNLSDVSQMLLYGENSEEQEGQEQEQEGQEQEQEGGNNESEERPEADV